MSGVAAAGRAAALSHGRDHSPKPGPRRHGQRDVRMGRAVGIRQPRVASCLETYKPDRVILLRGASHPGADPTGSVGRLGEGPLVASSSAFLRAAAATAGVATQALPDGWLRLNLPDQWKALDLHVASLPVRYAQTPVETVDADDVDALAALLTASVVLPPLGPSPGF